MRYRTFLVAALSLAAVTLGAGVAACGDDDDDSAADEVQLTEKDDGKSVSVSNGGSLIVALPSNPSTGFAWAIVPPEPGNLELDGEPKFVPAGSTTPVVGAGGTEVFTFNATESGKSTLNMEYRRSFEPGNPPEDTFTVQVEVK